jgi:1-acyl-sn-glycerol-3-phosphate acyltransferase
MPRAPLPVPGPSVPRRGGTVLRALGGAVLRLLGWRVEGGIPDVPRCVVIVAPHTSNWDFVVGLAALLALDLRIRWLGKHTIFRGPFGALWRALGGVPVDRTAPHGTVDATARLFSSPGPAWVALAPEGTRHKVERWKSGFWRIARAGGAPILPVALDHGRRRLRFAPLFTPTADQEADVLALRRNFSADMARRPDRYW